MCLTNRWIRLDFFLEAGLMQDTRQRCEQPSVFLIPNIPNIPAAPWLCFAFSGARCVFAAWLRSSRIHYRATYSTRGCRCQDPFPLSRGKGAPTLDLHRTDVQTTIQPPRGWYASKQRTQKACKNVITQTQRPMYRSVSERHLHNNFTHCRLSHRDSMKHARNLQLGSNLVLQRRHLEIPKRPQSHNSASKAKPHNETELETSQLKGEKRMTSDYKF